MFLTQYWHADVPEEVAVLVASQRAANPGLVHRLFDRAGATHGLAALSGLLPAEAQGVVFERSNQNVINGCIGFRTAGHPLAALLQEIAIEGIERRVSNSVWVTTGPGILTYLLLLTRLDAHDRATLDFDDIGLDVTRSVRLCAEIALRRFPDLDSVFEGIAVRRFEELQAIAPEAEMAYKAGPLHWVGWEGSIFSSEREGATG